MGGQARQRSSSQSYPPCPFPFTSESVGHSSLWLWPRDVGSSGTAGQGGMLCATTILGRLGTPAMNMGFKEMLLEQLGAVVMLLLRRMGAKNHHKRLWIPASGPERDGVLAGQLESLASQTEHPRLGREQGQVNKNLKYGSEREEEACRSLTSIAANSFCVNVICKYSTNYL